MTKTLKKMTLVTGALAASAAPIATVISCGGGSSIDLYVGIRPEDSAMWQEVGAQFEKATGKKVGFRLISGGMDESYTLWKGSNSLPHVTIADAGTAQRGHLDENKWFQMIDIEEIIDDYSDFEEAFPSQGGFDDEYAINEDLELSDEYFNMNMLNTSLESGTEYRSMPTIWGPRIIYSWTHDKAGNDLFTGDTDLEWYVPVSADDTTGGVEKVTFTGDTPETNPLIKEDGTTYKNSYDDIQEFITNAGKKSELDFNTDDYTAALVSDDSEDRVIATGSAGMNQRLHSVSITLVNSIENDADKPKATSIVDPGLSFTNLIQGQAGLYADGDNMAIEEQGVPILDDEKWANYDKEAANVTADDYKLQIGTKENPATKAGYADLTEVEAIEYISQLGYISEGNVGTALGLKEGSSADPFGKGDTLMMEGAIWQSGSVFTIAEQTDHYKETVIEDGEVTELGSITAFGVPFMTSGVDGYAISHDISGDKLDLAKYFIRFLMQKQAAADITGTKAVSMMRDAQALVEVDGPLATGISASGVASIAADNRIDNIQDTYSKLSSDAMFDPYNNMFLQEDFSKTDGHITGADGNNATGDAWAARINTVNAAYWKQQI